ncbi:hypothetical protein BH11PSE11_BH11PSE11_14300 [soil metagenome]
MNHNDMQPKNGMQAAKLAKKVFSKFLILGVAALGVSMIHIPKAQAARCSADASGNWTCAKQERNNAYWCGVTPWSRKVRWQVPEGTAPAGGWRTAFYYQGTTPTGTDSFKANVGASFGMIYLPQTIHEMLDDPTGSGKKYAVFAPEPPNSTVFLQFWHTNVVVPYSASCDYSFFNDFFAEIAGGSYGAASLYNLSRRFAYGISSGGYNSSRMAVTFNGSSLWKALGVISASYATCSGPVCGVPTLPANHPPTKFWHGTADNTVPISTMRLYYNQLVAQGIQTQKVEHTLGHQLTSHDLGPGGVKAWFDAHY